MKILIRPYKSSDYSKVKETLEQSDLFDPVWESEQNIKGKIKRDPESILVAEAEKQVIGCVFIVEDGWNAFLWRLCVQADFRNKGIGVKLIQQAEKIIANRGLKEVSLFIDSKNKPLKNWYKKHD
jgi:ribosomal protein S18 acetylase RimI-like enzyme